MKKLLGLMLLCQLHFVFAQNRISSYSDTKTENWTMRKFNNDPLNTRHYTFNNGLTLITSENRTTPRVYTMVAVKTGSKNDPSTNTGLAHYLEHMLFKGTDKYGTAEWEKEKQYLAIIDSLYEKYNTLKDESQRELVYRMIDSVSQVAAKFAIANEFDKMCQAIGAQGTNAFTSNDMTVYINDIPSNNIEKWLVLESERYRNPILRLFHTELEAVYEEKNIGIDQDMSQVWEKLYGELFKNHNYGKQTTIGTIEHLKNPSLKAIREYYNTYYVPNNMAIIMSGDINPDELAKSVYEKFAYMKPKPVPNYSYIPEEPRNIERIIDVVGPSEELSMLGYRVDYDNPKNIQKLKLVDLLLTNASAGILELELVKNQKILAAGSAVQTLKDYSVFILYGTPKEGQTLDSVKSLLLEGINKIKKGDFDAEMVKAIVLNEEISKLKAFNGNENRCSIIMEGYVNDKPYQNTMNELFEMSKITKEEIIEFAKEFLGNDRVVVYKKKGTTPENIKIKKPEIHPVELNRDKQSDFVKEWSEIKSNTLTPTFFDLSFVQSQQINNTPVFYVRNESNRLFNLTIRFNHGEYHNLNNSIAIEYLQLLGSNTKSLEAISVEMFKLGCTYKLISTQEFSYLTLQGPEESFDNSLLLISGWIKNLKADNAKLNALIQDYLKTRENMKSNVSVIQQNLGNYIKYGPYNPSTCQISNEEIQKLNNKIIFKTIADLFNSTREISYYGQRSLEDVTKALKKSGFCEKKYKEFVDIVSPKFKELSFSEPKVYFVDYPQVQANVRWYSPAGLFNPSNLTDLRAFNQYFGGDMSSVVFQTIRESKALAYSTNAILSIPNKANKLNYMTAFVGTQSDKFHDAIGSMNSLLNELPVNKEVFELSKQSLVNNIESNRILPENYVNTYWTMKRMNYSEDPSKLMYEKLKTINMQDVVKYHKEFVSNKTYHIGVVASKDRINDEDLKKYGKIEKLTLKQIYGY